MDDVEPAWRRITAAVERVSAAPLEVAFVGAAGGQLLAGAAELLDAEVQIREAQLGDILPWLRDGTVDVVLSVLPVQAPGLVTGPVLVSEPRMLAVPAGHAFARRDRGLGRGPGSRGHAAGFPRRSRGRCGRS